MPSDLFSTSAKGGPSLVAVVRRYWWPAYGVIRDGGASAAAAAMVTSRFLERLTNGSPFLRHEDHDGRLRLLMQAELTVVLARFGHGVTEGVVDPVVDVSWAESRDDYAAHGRMGDQFRRRWAMVVLELALAGLRASAVEAGTGDRVERLIPYLALRIPDWRNTDIAAAIDTSDVENLRDEFRSQVRRTVGQTVTTPMSLEVELLDLFA